MYLDRQQQSMKIALIFITIALQWLRIPNAASLSIDQNFASNQQSLSKNVEYGDGIINNSNAVNNNLNNSSLNVPAPTATNQILHHTDLIKHDNRRPIWALAHMVNSIKELNYRLSKGANAVEADVTFSRDGLPLFTYHGPPCDCWRHCHQQEEFNEYLSYVREIAIDAPTGIGQNLTLLFLDLKLDPLNQRAKVRAGQELAKSVMNNLFPKQAYDSTNVSDKLNATIRNETVSATTAKEGTAILQATSNNQQQQLQPPPKAHLKLILSVNHISDIDLINNFIHTLEINNSSHFMEHIGFDVGMNDDLQLIESMWRKFGNTLNLWQGDGYTNCFSPFYNLERLSRALTKRDNPTGYPAKVYHWTIDLHDRMRESLLIGVDAIMTNHPERLLDVLQEPEIAHDFRLATHGDNPFRKLTRRLVGRSSESARYQRSAHTNSGGFMGSLVDVLSSWLAYVREIPFLSFPTTLVSSRSSQKRSNRRTASDQKLALTPVRMQNQPEYKIENISGFHRAPSSTIAETGGKQQLSLSDTLDQSIVQSEGATNGDKAGQENVGESYDGPKWYVSLISNLLLSAMKIILPT